MKEKALHLSDDQVLVSLVDEEDLPEEMRRHLESCPECQQRRKPFLAELEGLGKMAVEMAPGPRRRPVLPVQESDRPRFRVPRYAMGLSAAVIVTFLCIFILFSGPSKETGTDLAATSEAGLYLLDDILDESSLSDQYTDITETSPGYFNDEFMEFVIPLEEEVGQIQGLLNQSFRA